MQPGQFGLLYQGSEAGVVTFGDGLRLLQGTIRRLPVQAANGQGRIVVGPGIVADSQGAGPGAILPGSTWYFQGWFRDPGGPCGSGFNLTPALEVSFQP